MGIFNTFCQCLMRKRYLTLNEEGINQHNEANRQNGGKPQTIATARKLADKYNVSPRRLFP